MREVWRKTLIQQVSGVSADVLLFSEHGSTLVHYYRVFGRGAAHTFMRWKFMAKLRTFTVQAEAEAKYGSGCVPIRNTPSPVVSDTLRRI